MNYCNIFETILAVELLFYYNLGTSREKELGSRALSITIAPNASSEALEVSSSSQVYPTKNDLFNEDTLLKPSNYPDKGYAPKRRHFKNDEIDYLNYMPEPDRT